MSTKLPKFPEPYWRSHVEIPFFPSLQEDINSEVTIVGGGITGITTGYLLSLAGKKVTIIDAGRLFNGTTGHTTAKVTAQHGIIYEELIQHFGEERAKMYYVANDSAKAFIKDTVSKQNISCEFEETEAYIYTNSEKELKKLEREAEAYKKLGIRGDLVNAMPLQLPMRSAIIMEKQAQFHPIKYLLPLVQVILKNGGTIYENTTAINIEKGEMPKVITRTGHTIESQSIISCSHFPFYDGKQFFFTRMYAERSYVVAVKDELDYPGGMYVSSETPKRSVRKAGNLLLLGGESHKTGQGINTMKHYEALASFGKDELSLSDILYRWSAQDLYTLDKVPYIGRLSTNKDNIFVATGFRKWGMTNSTAAALMLKDLILHGKSQYEPLFGPARLNIDPSVKTFISQNSNVAVEFVKGKIDLVDKQIEDVEVGEGVHVKINGEKCGAFRDEEGKLHVVNATCTHLGCEVAWNEGERSWDCPCHGSRFSIDGEVLEGPADQPLNKM
ncbi:MAG: FAD-dependent oxidoreductase [Bacillaceae bacterium]|nr:FAD-dependent oxidoreductase [Bacillaceae bacterium]